MSSAQYIAWSKREVEFRAVWITIADSFLPQTIPASWGKCYVEDGRLRIV